MRHLKHKNQLGRKKEHRAALMSNMAAALFRHGRIQTTLAKAKALRPFSEKLITLAVKAHKAEDRGRGVYLRRLAESRMRDKKAVQLLFNDRVEEFADRQGGYTRIYKLQPRRGDGAEMALIELIDADDEGYRSRRRKKAKPAEEEAKAAPEAGETEAEDSAAETEEAPGEESTAADAEASAEEASDEEADTEDKDKK